MARQREIMVGSRDRFAVKIAFLTDPDQGRAATREHSISWGAIEVWANGHNLCRHVEQGESIDAAHWYLLPILRWLALNWDFLLHEERLPGRNAARDAWISMQRTAEPPPALSDDAAEHWEVSWHNWWERHALQAAREGGLVPNLFIRWWRDLIELSWGDRPIAGAPDGFRFDANHGCARFVPGDVADVLYGILDDASHHLLNELPTSPAFAQLRDDVERLRSTDHRRRLGLLSGFRSDDLQPEDRWRQIESLFPADLPSEIGDAILGVQADKFVIKSSSQVALMFGSLSPSIDAADARTLAQKLVQFYDQSGENSNLRRVVKDVPVEGGDERAWKQGYQLAESCLEAIDGAIAKEPPFAVESLLDHFGISVESIALHDQSVRAVALAGPKHKPAVLVNDNVPYRSVQTRRFTLAHELCHILHDRNYGATLALASGPWAPVDVEKRANAFAAMLLMPTDLVGSVVRKLKSRLDSPGAIWEVANAFQTSFTATLDHLWNLGHIDEVTRDALRAEIEAGAVASSASHEA
jgi:Zn-dependent peptidase ImmA (M78 family)